MAQANYVIQLTVVNDGTLTNEIRLGAIGDIQYVIDQEDVADDLLILASDNLFEFESCDFVNFAKKYNSDALAMYYEDDINQLKRNGTASLLCTNILCSKRDNFTLNKTIFKMKGIIQMYLETLFHISY